MVYLRINAAPKARNHGDFASVSRFWDVVHVLHDLKISSTDISSLALPDRFRNENIIDIGCGNLANQDKSREVLSATTLVSKSKNYTGIDISRFAIDRSTDFYKDSPREISFIWADARDLSSAVREQSFDIAIMYNTLSLLGSDYDLGLKQAARTTKKRLLFDVLHTDAVVANRKSEVCEVAHGIVAANDDGAAIFGTDDATICQLVSEIGFKIERLRVISDDEDNNHQRQRMFIEAVRKPISC